MDIIDYKGRELHLTVRSNAVRLSMRHRPGQSWIDVTMPSRCPKRDLIKFLDTNLGWIDTELAAEKSRSYTPCGAAGERAWLLGRLVTLGQDGIPAGDDFIDLRSKALHDEIVRLLPIWQQRMGVKARQIRWRDMVSKWGSCQTRDKLITLNTKLGAMPVECIEYVLVHELCHLIHPDHSPAFHNEMTRFLPDWKKRKERLNHFGPLHLPPEGVSGEVSP